MSPAMDPSRSPRSDNLLLSLERKSLFVSLSDMEIALEIQIEGKGKSLQDRIMSVEHALGLTKKIDATEETRIKRAESQLLKRIEAMEISVNGYIQSEPKYCLSQRIHHLKDSTHHVTPERCSSIELEHSVY